MNRPYNEQAVWEIIDYFPCQNSMPPKMHSIFRYGKWIATILCLAYLAGRLDRHRLGLVFSSGELEWWWAAFILFIPNVLLQAWRWHLLITASLPGPDRTFRHSLQGFLGGSTLGLITPGGSGEAGRTFFYPPGSWRRVTAAFGLDKLLTVGVICLGATLVGLGELFLGVATPGAYFNGVMAVLGFFWLVVLGLGWLIRSGRSPYVNRLWDRFKPYLPKLGIRSWLQILMITYIHYLVVIFQYYLVCRAFFPLKFTAVVNGTALALGAMTFFPFTIGQIGVREAALAAFLPQAPEVHIIAGVAFSIFLFNFAAPAALGCVALVRMREW
jgi:hypothetical protein